MRPKPTGTVTFLFTDIEGSTRLAQEFRGERWNDLLARHRELIRAGIASVGGHEEKTEGDAFVAVFGRASDAVRAAVDAQRRLAAEPWPGDVTLRVRMGLHSGDGMLDADGEYVGADVHRAARVAGAGHGGQVLLSETTSALVADELPEGVAIRGLGEHRLKDLRPERIFQLVIDGLQSDFPPIRTLDRRPNNLPTQLTSFVGREAELRDAAKLLATTRLLTLTGPGGTGKTRLSLQLAADVGHEFADGVWFVPLEPVRDPSLIASRIASVLGLVESAGRSARDLLVDWLGQRHILLVLDNFEQVIEGAPVVADLLRSSERLSVIATSRAPLRVSGEQEYPVPGLPVPRDILALSDLEKLNLPQGRARPRGRRDLAVRGGPAVHRPRARRSAGLHGHERECPGRRRDLLPAPRDAAGDRARGGARQAASAGGDSRATRAPARRPGGRLARPARAPADASGSHLLELRAPRRG